MTTNRNRATNFPNGIRTPGTEAIASYLSTVISGFGEIKTNARVPIIELKSTYGLSVLRDIQSVTGSAAISNDRTEYLLTTGTTTASTAELGSAANGRYIPGFEAQAGIGVRIDHEFTGTQYAEWGYFDVNNGFGFGQDATGVYVFILREGTYSRIYQDDWNCDKVDGTGPTETTLIPSRGNIYNVDFAWYGYGVADFSTYLTNPDGKQIRVVVHRFQPSGETSIANPNLPITALVSNGDTTENIDLFVGGRQFSIYTQFQPNLRINAQERLAMSAIGETFLPVISFRKKTDFKFVAVNVEGMDGVVTETLLYELRLQATLTGASFVTPTDTTASETACEVDISATAVSGGDVLYKGLLGAGGIGVNRSGDKTAKFDFELPDGFTITLCVRRVAGTGGTISAVLRWLEEW